MLISLLMLGLRKRAATVNHEFDRFCAELEIGRSLALPLSGIDLAAVAVLAVPLWALPVADRPTVAALCEHP